jgi:hypothetical protein
MCEMASGPTEQPTSRRPQIRLTLFAQPFIHATVGSTMRHSGFSIFVHVVGS